MRTAEAGALEAQSRIHEAQILAQFAEKELERNSKLYAGYIVSTRDLERAQSDLGRLRVTVAALQAAGSMTCASAAFRKKSPPSKLSATLWLHKPFA